MKEKKEAMLNVMITQSQREFVEKEATKQDISLSQYIRQLLKKTIEKTKNNK